jgi:hypothetical protein
MKLLHFTLMRYFMDVGSSNPIIHSSENVYAKKEQSKKTKDSDIVKKADNISKQIIGLNEPTNNVCNSNNALFNSDLNIIKSELNSNSLDSKTQDLFDDLFTDEETSEKTNGSINLLTSFSIENENLKASIISLDNKIETLDPEISNISKDIKNEKNDIAIEKNNIAMEKNNNSIKKIDSAKDENTISNKQDGLSENLDDQIGMFSGEVSNINIDTLNKKSTDQIKTPKNTAPTEEKETNISSGIGKEVQPETRKSKNEQPSMVSRLPNYDPAKMQNKKISIKQSMIRDTSAILANEFAELKKNIANHKYVSADGCKIIPIFIAPKENSAKPSPNVQFIKLPSGYNGNPEEINLSNLPKGATLVSIGDLPAKDRKKLEKLIADYLICAVKLYNLQNNVHSAKSQNADKETTDNSSLEKDEGVNISPQARKRSPKQTESSQNETSSPFSYVEFQQNISEGIAQKASENKQAIKDKRKKDQEISDQIKSIVKAKDLNMERIEELHNICDQKIYNLEQIRYVTENLNLFLKDEVTLKDSEIKTIINTIIKESINFEDTKFISIIIDLYNHLLESGKERFLIVKLGRMIKSFGPGL